MAGDGGSRSTADEIEARLLRFIERELLRKESTPVDRDEDLLSGDRLDSVGVLRLAAFVAEEFDFEVEPADFVVENFRSVAALTGYVQRVLGRSS